MSDGEALRRRIDDLSPMGVRFVARMVESLSKPPQAQGSAPEPTWISAESDWIEYFGLLVSAHHGLAVDALKETGFENAFRDACEAVGWGCGSAGVGDAALRGHHGPGARRPSPKVVAEVNSRPTAVEIHDSHLEAH